ncbi:hypothetical protein [Leeuwenhoekiella sp. LLG6367-2.1]|uniref:hypothetical protein n=1 Tax=Leeuwenhoekiella sp. LLG6367-2.1 TaxID=3160833 RepID=UPI00386C77D4
MKKFNTGKEAQEYYKKIADTKFKKTIDSLGLSTQEIETLNIEQLQNKIEFINKILSDDKRLRKLGDLNYFLDEDYYVPENNRGQAVGYGYDIANNLIAKKREILEIIRKSSRENKIQSVTELIKNIGDSNLKDKISQEIQELNDQSGKFDEQEKEIDKEAERINSMKEELEISKGKLDLLDKKSQIWLKILAKESIASIIGGLILFIMSICILVAMFLKLDTSKIVESAFLLILGYFFGQSVSKK